MVEHLLAKEGVTGSNPASRFNSARLRLQELEEEAPRCSPPGEVSEVLFFCPPRTEPRKPEAALGRGASSIGEAARCDRA